MKAHLRSLLSLAPAALLMMSGCEPIRSDVFHAPPGPPDAGTRPPETDSGQTDAGTRLFCYEDQVLGEELTFAFDAQGAGHFAYVEAYVPYLATTRAQDAPEIVSLINTERILDLELDPRGHRHLLTGPDIASSDNFAIKYIREGDGTWKTSDSPCDGELVELAIDPHGVPHVLCDDLGWKYASNPLGTWKPQSLSISSPVSGTPALTVDVSGYAHIAFGASDGSGLRYASNASGTWVVEQIDPTGRGQPHLTLDPEGHPHLFYMVTSGEYFHATKVSTAWQRTRIEGGAGAAASLMVDLGGTIHAVFDSSPSSLSYAKGTGGSWSVMPLLSIDGDGGLTQVSFSLDTEGRPIVGYEYGMVGGNGDKVFHLARPRPCP